MTGHFIGRLLLTDDIDRDDYFILEEAFGFYSPTLEEKIVVPAKFDTDFASIPWFLRWWLSPTGKVRRAAVIHDFLYWYRKTLAEGGVDVTRKLADRLFLQAMEAAGMGRVRYIYYAGVRIGGWWAWWDNARRRARGE